MDPQTRKGRIQKEFKNSGDFKVITVDGNINHWKAFIDGPINSPYQGGVFQIDIQLTDEYPTKPPIMKFDTQIFHPNISDKTGDICIDILNKWITCQMIDKVLVSIQALMSDPNLHEMTFKNKDAGIYYQNESIKKFIEMGFDEKSSRVILNYYGWDQSTALNHLLMNSSFIPVKSKAERKDKSIYLIKGQ